MFENFDCLEWSPYRPTSLLRSVSNVSATCVHHLRLYLDTSGGVCACRRLLISHLEVFSRRSSHCRDRTELNYTIRYDSKYLLHFASGIAEAKYILVNAVCVSVCLFVCVCLSVCPSPHSHTIARTRM